MAQDNSQNRKDSKKKLFSDLFKRSPSPDPSGPSQKRSLTSRIKSKFSKSTSSLTEAEASSVETPGGGTPSNLLPVALGSVPQDASFLTIGPTGHAAHSMTPAPSEANLLDVTLAVEDPPILSAIQGPTQSAALSSQAPGNTSSSTGISDSAQSAHEDAELPLKRNLKLTGRVLQTFFAKAVDIADTDPIKVALGLVKVIVDIKNAVKDNKDAITRQIIATGTDLEAVVKALDGWKPGDEQGTSFIDKFNDALNAELRKLNDLNNEHKLQKILDYEDEQARIKDIFVHMNDTRAQFELVLRIKVFKMVYRIDEVVKDQSLDRLKPSHIADHDYSGREGQMLRRQVCTKGTRVRILGNIVTWANNISPDCPNVYWLFGHAGSGKSTIACTVTRHFEFASGSDDMIVLGGNFFCSRQFSETSDSIYIIRTLVYHLALKCKPFADALPSGGLDYVIYKPTKVQLNSLLFEPWQKSEAGRLKDTSMPLHFLFVIDALDEIHGTGGSEFLHALVATINEIHKESLNGLKFFVTSRSDPSLVEHVKSLEQKELYYLQDVEQEEAHADVATYLKASLPKLVGSPELDKLVDQADGLFIYAATVVKHLDKYNPVLYKQRLATLFVSASTLGSEISKEMSLDTLYYQILVDACQYIPVEYYLNILHAFLCTAEQTSISAIAELALSPELASLANDVLQSLHTVLYTEDNIVLTYHKSFPDFIFDKSRSKEFWCDKVSYHYQLTTTCFNIMESLHFNMANIPSSYILDCANDTFAAEVKQNISPGLSYVCRNWDYHLSATEPAPVNTLLETLSEFLKLKALFWIEAMNLLNQRDHCYPMLQTAHHWVMKSEGKSPLPENLAEGSLFAQYFSAGSAWRSTPHLYISALATWPRKSDPIQGWRSYFSGIPKFTNASIGATLLMFLNVGSWVYSVALSSNSHYIVSGSSDHLVRVWNTLTGQEKYVLSGHTDTVCSVAFSHNGNWIVSGSHDGFVRVWDALKGQEKFVLDGHTGWVYSVAISKDGCYIVSGSVDKSIIIWNASTGQTKHVLKGHTDGVLSVAFSPDGRHIISGSADNSVRVWNTATGKESYILNGHTDDVNSVAFSPDGSYIASGSDDKSVCIWNIPTHQQMHVLNGHTAIVYSVAFSSDSKHIVSGSRDHLIRVWDALTGQQMHILNGHTNTVASVAFSSNGRHIVSGSADNSIRVWSALIDQDQHALNGHTDIVRSVAFSYDGTQIVSCSDDKTVQVWDAMKGLQKLVLMHPDRVLSVAFSPDARHIVSGLADKSVRIWDAVTGLEKHVLIGHTDAVNSVSYSANGNYIASGSHDKSIRIWNALTGKVEHVLNGHTDSVYSVAFSTDGSYIVSGSWDKSVRVWDALTGLQRLVLNSHTDEVYSVAFSLDGKHIASGSQDRSIRVWDALTGQQSHILKGHTDIVISVAFSSDGTQIVSGSEDKSVYIWDTLTGQAKHVLHGHTSSIMSVAFSIDGSQIVSSGGYGDTTVKVWVNPAHYLPHYIQEKIVTPAGHLQPSGWLLSPEGDKYLMFVPTGAALPDDAHLLTIPSSKASYVDFFGSNLGLEWAECYSL